MPDNDCAAGNGKLEVLLGLPLQRQLGPETVSGEALRYLAELPFAPPAMVLNDQLAWSRIDERRAEVATGFAGGRLAVTLGANSQGEIVHSSPENRLFRTGSEWVPRPWGGHVGDYQTLGGIRIPTSGDAYWELPEGRYVYWRGTVMSAELIDRPFRRRLQYSLTLSGEGPCCILLSLGASGGASCLKLVKVR